MLSFRTSVLALALAVGCADLSTSDEDLELAAAEDGLLDPTSGGKADAPSWETAPTVHVGARLFDAVGKNGRRIHALWVGATRSAPVSLKITVAGQENAPVRVAILGPLKKDGTRETIAAAGYAKPVSTASVAVRLTSSGQHLVVIGTYNLATEAGYHVEARCSSGCAASRLDALASPKDGALVGTVAGGRLLSMTLGSALAGRGEDVEVQVFASRPMVSWAGELVATGVASGNQVNVLLPASVVPGDDLRLVVRDPRGTVHDTGLVVRWAPSRRAFARLDAILYSDLGGIDVAGVAGFFEGVAGMALRSETRGIEIVTAAVRADRPGQVTNGFASFDVTFAPELFLPGGELNPVLPRDGELLSVGQLNGNGDFVRLGCFEYCNDLAGFGTCTGGPRPCPSAD